MSVQSSIRSVSRRMYEQSPGKNKAPGHVFAYKGQGLVKIHRRFVAYEGDYTNEAYERISPDNGRTWSEWRDVYQSMIWPKEKGEELWTDKPAAGTYNPVHGHYVAMSMQRLFPFGHVEDYRLLWAGKAGCIDHTYIHVSENLDEWQTPTLVTYEEGAEYDENDWLNPAYTEKNLAYVGCNLEIDANGDILFPIGARVENCCSILGIRSADIFPSCPHIANGLIVVRGVWDKEKKRYEWIPSKPVLISDLKSSRGIDEPTLLILKNGRIIVVFRGSNADMPAWNTRLAPKTPAYKWFTFSDDGGKTFSDPVPYTFDDGEPVYSPASISLFVRSEKNGKGYWIGNITPADTKGSYPREPLVMAEVDEETGLLKKSTYVVIDQRNPETESERLQLSNFTVFQDRETGLMEIHLTKIEANSNEKYTADAWVYTVAFA